MQFVQERHEVLQAAVEAVDAPGHDDIELTACGSLAERVELRALVSAFGAAGAVVLVDLGDLAAHPAGDLAANTLVTSTTTAPFAPLIAIVPAT